MSVALPYVRVGNPVRHEALSIFPLFANAASPVEYLLSDEGIGSGAITVEEVSQAGSVPDLLVENKGDIRILFIEGEEPCRRCQAESHPQYVGSDRCP